MAEEDAKAPVPVTIVDPPVEEVAPADEFVHPGRIDGYEVLDLTAQYGQSHDPVPGYYRVTSLKDTELNVDVVTEAPSGPNGEITKGTEATIKSAIRGLEARRKGK